MFMKKSWPPSNIETCCHCTPAEAPSTGGAFTVGMENNFHPVTNGGYRWRQEVKGRRWRRGGETASVVHQRCPIPIGDRDKVTGTGGEIFANPDGKAVEL